MLEIYKKQNGEYENKSIKLNDLGMNQSIEFTPLINKDGEGTYGKWYLVEGIYHSEQGDIERVSMFAGVGYYSKLVANLNKRCKITKTKKEGAKFHSYDVEPVDGSSSPSPLKLSKQTFTPRTDDLKDGDGVYSDKFAVDLLKKSGSYDKVEDYIGTWKQHGSTEERAREVFEHRGEL